MAKCFSSAGTRSVEMRTNGTKCWRKQETHPSSASRGKSQATTKEFSFWVMWKPMDVVLFCSIYNLTGDCKCTLCFLWCGRMFVMLFPPPTATRRGSWTEETLQPATEVHHSGSSRRKTLSTANSKRTSTANLERNREWQQIGRRAYVCVREKFQSTARLWTSASQHYFYFKYKTAQTSF